MSDLKEEFTEVRNDLAEVKRRMNCVAFFRRNWRKIDFTEDVDVFLENNQIDSAPIDEEDKLILSTNKKFVQEFYPDLQDVVDKQERKRILDNKAKRLEKKESRLEKKKSRLEEKEMVLIHGGIREDSSSLLKPDNKEEKKGIDIILKLIVFSLFCYHRSGFLLFS